MKLLTRVPLFAFVMCTVSRGGACYGYARSRRVSHGRMPMISQALYIFSCSNVLLLYLLEVRRFGLFYVIYRKHDVLELEIYTNVNPNLIFIYLFT